MTYLTAVSSTLICFSNSSRCKASKESCSEPSELSKTESAQIRFPVLIFLGLTLVGGGGHKKDDAVRLYLLDSQSRAPSLPANNNKEHQ